MSITHHLPFARSAVAVMLATTLTAGLTGCSSSSGGSTSTSISGSVFAAPVSGASCEIQDNNGNIIAGPFTSSATGGYSANIPNASLDDDLMLICNGGSYTDEADGTNQTAGTMAAYAAGGTLGTNVGLHATPESTIIYQLMSQYGKTFAEAQTAFKTAFGYTPDTTIAPTDATSPDTGATDDQLLAGLHAAAFSQLTVDLGLSPGQQFALLAALAQDLADGTLDSVDASGTVNIDGDSTLPLPVDIQNQFVISMLKFHHDDTKNLTGLSNDKIGTLPFSMIALTSSYKVKYIPGMMDAMEGKSQFKIRVSDHNDIAVTGEMVKLMPMMHMPDGRNHATPVDGDCIESGIAGTYDCTVYYLMASTMMDGSSMGYWHLKTMIGGMMGETAGFYPPVKMAMADTARIRLKSVGVDDMVMSMNGPVNRNYNLFKSSLTGMTGNHQFQIFVTAMENMMSFPAVFQSAILNLGDMNYELTISSMSVEFSTDLSTWIPADGSSNDGYWTASNITGLTNGSAGEIYVRMTINGTQYSTNGETAAGINAYGTFFVTPGSM